MTIFRASGHQVKFPGAVFGKTVYGNIQLFYPELAERFARVADIEKRHEERYRKLAANIAAGEVWVKVGERRWECRNCGHIYIGDKAPEVCPTCNHPKAYFEIEAQNY